MYVPIHKSRVQCNFELLQLTTTTMNQILLSSLRVLLLGTIFTTSVHSQVFTSLQNIGGVINSYTDVTAIPNSNTFTVSNPSLFSACDKVLIIQMKGATISTTDDASFGDITTIGNAGNFEEIFVGSISGNDITFQSNFINPYDVTGLVQVITIPQYTAGATITGDLTCQAWNGTTGGVLIFEATDLYLGHMIDVSGMGFRKGEENGANLDHCLITDVSPPYDYATPNSDIKAAEKGEGIVVEASLLHGRGKLASGGGGGNVHNGGGGGGSNYGAGGLGGYAATVCSPDAIAQVQGQGIGGVTLSTHYGTNKIFMGGAGGAGQGNNNSSSSSSPNAQNDFNYGGNGGGIIIATIDQLIIDWSTSWDEWYILADGENAPQNTGSDTPVLYDGAGGGGAGGTIILEIGTIDNQTGDGAREPIISAIGGTGGYNMNGSADCYAPGGGGGGGVIAWLSGTQPANIQSVSFNEGAAGQKNPAQSCPGTYGATDGTTGNEMFNYTIPVGTTSTLPPSVSIVADQNNVCAGTMINFTATPTNGGANPTFQWLVNGSVVGTNSTTFSSSSLTNNDTVNVVITTSGGCGPALSDTSVKITMIINPTVIPTVSISADMNNVCTGTNVTFSSTVTGEGSSPNYQWQVNGSNAGTDSPTFSSSSLANNDDVTLILTSNEACASPTLVTSPAITMIISGTVTPTVSIAEDQNNICSGETIIFTATISGGGSTPAYQWLLNGGNIGTDASTFSSSSLNNGDVIGVVLTSSSACASPTTANSNDINVTVNPNLTPTAVISEDQNSVCSGTDITFTSVVTNEGAGPTYQWMVNGGNVGTNSNSYNSTTLSNGDQVTLELTSNATCATPTVVTSNAIDIIINSTVVPTVSITADMNNVCTGTKVTFSSTVTDEGSTPNYQWTVNGGIVGTDSPTFNSTTLNDGDQVQLILTSSEPCSTGPVNSNVVDIIIVSSATPSVTIFPTSANICEGENLTFTATDNNAGLPTFQWYINSSPVGTDSDTYGSTLFNDGDVIMVGIKSSLTCGTTDTANSSPITVNVNPIPVPTISGNNSICEGISTILTANGGLAGADYNWFLNGSSTGGNSENLTASTGGIYTVEITNPSTCNGTSSGFILSETNISINAGPDLFLEEGSSVVIQGSSNATSVLWNNAGNLDNPNSTTPNASPLVTTTYTITGDLNGCTKSDSMTIFISQPILIPNAFTPNNDGENDQWIISGLETYPNATLQIFNRWGSLVYKSVGTYIPWDGTRSGSQMPVATYYYLLTTNTNEETISGSITLVR